MSFVNLTDSNILLYAAKCYDKPNCIDSEFDEDYKRIRYIKRLLHRYRISGTLKERLILNHIIVLGNVFGVDACVRMLFYKIDIEDYAILKTFLLFLNYMPLIVKGINGKNIISGDIGIDVFVARTLRNI